MAKRKRKRSRLVRYDQKHADQGWRSLPPRANPIRKKSMTASERKRLAQAIKDGQHI